MESDPYFLDVKERQEYKTEVLQEYERIFKASDLDKSGFIDRNEVDPLLKNLGYRNFTEDDVNTFMQKVDFNKDGKISFREFLALMKIIAVPGGDKEIFQRLETKEGKGIIRFTSKRDSMSYSSFSEEERTAYVKVINAALADDPVCQKYLPIDPETNDVFPRLKNGILLCKLINKAVPDTIDERVINTKDNMNVFNETENLKLGIAAAKSIGIKLVGVNADTFRNEDKTTVLGLMWQIVKKVVLVKITLKNYPQLVRLLNPGEELSEFLKLSPEQILLRWFNYHLNNANYPKKITNFSGDVTDSEKYTILLNQLDRDHCGKEALNESDLHKRADMVISNAKKVGAESYIKNSDIVNGNNNLNLLFTASIFNSCHGLDPPTEQEAFDAAKLLDDDAEGTREERAYRMWVNSLGITDGDIHNLYEECKDGVLMCKIFDKIRPGVVNWKNVDPTTKNRFKKVVNCNEAVNAAKKNYRVVGIGGGDINRGDKKFILALIWQAMRDHQLQTIGNKTEQQLIDWGNSVVDEEHKIKDLKDKSLCDSLFFLDICKYIEPRSIDWSYIVKGSTDPKDLESNAKYCLSVARKLEALIFLVWEDITEVKSGMLLTLLASLYDVNQKYKK